MLKRIIAIGFIFLGSTIGWIILAASISVRTNNSGSKLRPGMTSTWGAPQQQIQPVVTLESIEPGSQPLAQGTPAPGSTPVTPTPAPAYIDAERSRIHADLALEHRQKGLLWYSTYVVGFSGSYTFRNSAEGERFILFYFPLPAQNALYDDLAISVAGRTLPFKASQNAVSLWVRANPDEAVEFTVAYRSRGLESWRYNFGKNVTQTRNFELTLNTNFRDIDFPQNTLSPVTKRETKNGWELGWRYRNLISGFEIGMTLPDKLQPGPLAGDISAFAPVSLLMFFFVMFIVTTLRGIELHPMNYFFLAAAFFAFHLLLAYSVDHMSIQLAFALSSVVSIGLVVSYLRLVVGPRFALAEAGLAQFVYLVLFSSSFFLKGFTGLAITIGSISTLFVVMQLTARVQWREHFGPPVPKP